MDHFEQLPTYLPFFRVDMCPIESQNILILEIVLGSGMFWAILQHTRISGNELGFPAFPGRSSDRRSSIDFGSTSAKFREDREDVKMIRKFANHAKVDFRAVHTCTHVVDLETILENKYFISKIGFDTAEKRTSNFWPAYLLKRFFLMSIPLQQVS